VKHKWITAAVLLCSGLAVVAILAALLSWLRNLDRPIPHVRNIRSIEFIRWDSEKQSKVGIPIPREHWESLLSALLPARKDNDPAKWRLLGELALTLSDGGSFHISLYDPRERLGAFSAGPTHKERVYYRGGRSEDLKAAIEDALSAARKAE